MSKPNKTLIIWEKWIDPFGNNTDDIEWNGFQNKKNDDDEYYDSYSDTNEKIPRYQKFNAIVTNMGIIPYNEHTDCSKIFNFWLGHTNFSITKQIAKILEEIDGVETLDIFTRYRFRVGFGKAFNDREVINNINTTIETLFI